MLMLLHIQTNDNKHISHIYIYHREDLNQGWANYGPPSNFLRPANNFSELARIFVGNSILGFPFSLQRLCVDDDPIKENVIFTS